MHCVISPLTPSKFRHNIPQLYQGVPSLQYSRWETKAQFTWKRCRTDPLQNESKTDLFWKTVAFTCKRIRQTTVFTNKWFCVWNCRELSYPSSHENYFTTKSIRYWDYDQSQMLSMAPLVFHLFAAFSLLVASSRIFFTMPTFPSSMARWNVPITNGNHAGISTKKWEWRDNLGKQWDQVQRELEH